MRLESPLHDTAIPSAGKASRDATPEPARIQLIVDGQRRPVCAPNRVLLESGHFWSGYRLELLRIPAVGILERVSTPGLRRYVGVNEIPRVRNGLGMAILSTSKGLMSDREARQARTGGELLAKVW